MHTAKSTIRTGLTPPNPTHVKLPTCDRDRYMQIIAEQIGHAPSQIEAAMADHCARHNWTATAAASHIASLDADEMRRRVNESRAARGLSAI